MAYSRNTLFVYNVPITKEQFRVYRRLFRAKPGISLAHHVDQAVKLLCISVFAWDIGGYALYTSPEKREIIHPVPLTAKHLPDVYVVTDVVLDAYTHSCMIDAMVCLGLLKVTDAIVSALDFYFEYLVLTEASGHLLEVIYDGGRTSELLPAPIVPA